MKVKELIQALEQLPDQDATVVISHGGGLDVFLVVTGIVPRNIRRLDGNPDFAGLETSRLSKLSDHQHGHT
jgi:hypothetical protein